MEKHFNFERFMLVVKKFWFENRQALFFLLSAVAAMLMIWLGVYMSFRNPALFRESFQIGFYFTGLLMSGCLSANYLFADLRIKAKAINYILLPASALEKMLCALFFGVIVFWIRYTLAFYVVDTVMVAFSNRLYGTTWSIINIFALDQYENPFFEKPPHRLFLIYLTFQALFIAGSVYFSRYSFFKTVIVLLVIWIVVLFLPNIVFSFLPAGNFYGSITAFEVLDFRGNKLIEMPAWFSFAFVMFFFWIAAPALWLYSYFKLKEKEIS